MKILTLMVSIVFAFAAFADARPLIVGAPDGSGNVMITIGGTGTQNQTLIAAWANGDKGNDPLDWTEYADAGTVVPSDTSKTFQIPAAWRAKSGAVRFFLMSGTPPYRARYDYITRPNVSADGDLYINTGIAPDATCDIAVKVQSPDLTSSDMCPFGVGGALFVFGTGAANTYWFDFLGAEMTTADKKVGPLNVNVFGDAPPQDDKPHTFRLNREGLFIDGYRHLAFDPSTITETTTSKISLFARGTGKQKGTTCSIFGATISTNGVLACDLVPAAAPSGKVQMWDRVTGGWKGPSGNQSGSLAFVAGNDIGPYPPDCGAVESVSDVIGFGPAITITMQDAATRSVSVSFSSGHDEGLLFAVADAMDAGTTYSTWANAMFVQKVAADVDSVTATLPEGWWRSHSNVRFAWKSISGANYDYAVESLASDGDGKAYIRTEWTPTTNTTTRVVSRTAFDTCPFGVTGGYYVFLGTKSAYTKINWGFFTSVATGSTLTGQLNCDDPDGFVSAFHVWQLGPGGVFIDDLNTPKATLAEFAPNASLTANICLPFRATSYNNHGIVSKTGDVETKGAKIWEGDVLVRDFVPCVKDGVPQFYDNVRGKYYPSVSGTQFASGDIIAADGDFVAWSNCRALRSGFVIIFR